MTKTKTKFVCSECGAVSIKWQGRCAECGNWNTFIEEIDIPATKAESWSVANLPSKLKEIELEKNERMLTGINEFDRCIGGGLVKGALILIGGVPGIGKSTILLQISDSLGKNYSKVLYVSGEESLTQIKLRSERLNIKAENIFLLSEINLEIIKKHIKEISPNLVVIDSIQTLFDENIAGTPGSISQVRQCVLELMKLAKTLGITIVIAGHVTKEGCIAGPKLLEHMVDVVLYFEGDNVQDLRLLRCVKNRFGATNEVGVFQMTSIGLEEISDISKFLVSQKVKKSPGSVIAPVIEGTRSFLIELQALATKTNFGLPARKSAGIELNRLSLIIAVLEKRIGLALSASDVFINVAGGIFVNETAVDLAVAAAIFSSCKNKIISDEIVIFGEVGLLGEVRNVPYAEKRIKEAEKMGFSKCILPKSNINDELKKYKIELIGVENLSEALNSV